MTCLSMYKEFYSNPAEILLTLVHFIIYERQSSLCSTSYLVFVSRDLGDSCPQLSTLWASVHSFVHSFILQTSTRDLLCVTLCESSGDTVVNKPSPPLSRRPPLLRD